MCMQFFLPHHAGCFLLSVLKACNQLSLHVPFHPVSCEKYRYQLPAAMERPKSNYYTQHDETCKTLKCAWGILRKTYITYYNRYICSIVEFVPLVMSHDEDLKPINVLVTVTILSKRLKHVVWWRNWPCKFKVLYLLFVKNKLTFLTPNCAEMAAAIKMASPTHHWPLCNPTPNWWGGGL